MRNYQYAQKEKASQSSRTPVSRLSEFQPSAQPSLIQAKSNEEGLAEHAERLKKFQRLGNSMIQMGPPRLDNNTTSSLQTKPWIQGKLTNGQPGDKYEKEADRVASQVVQQSRDPAKQVIACEQNCNQRSKNGTDFQLVQPQTNSAPGEKNSGICVHLKSGLEQISGSDKRAVWDYNDLTMPARMNVDTYAQGPSKYLGSKGKRHFSQNGGHEVQQMQGQARPAITTYRETIKDSCALNGGSNWQRTSLVEGAQEEDDGISTKKTGLANTAIQRLVVTNADSDAVEDIEIDPKKISSAIKYNDTVSALSKLTKRAIVKKGTKYEEKLDKAPEHNYYISHGIGGDLVGLGEELGEDIRERIEIGNKYNIVLIICNAFEKLGDSPSMVDNIEKQLRGSEESLKGTEINITGTEHYMEWGEDIGAYTDTPGSGETSQKPVAPNALSNAEQKINKRYIDLDKAVGNMLKDIKEYRHKSGRAKWLDKDIDEVIVNKVASILGIAEKTSFEIEMEALLGITTTKNKKAPNILASKTIGEMFDALAGYWIEAESSPDFSKDSTSRLKRLEVAQYIHLHLMDDKFFKDDVPEKDKEQVNYWRSMGLLIAKYAVQGRYELFKAWMVKKDKILIKRQKEQKKQGLPLPSEDKGLASLAANRSLKTRKVTL